MSRPRAQWILLCVLALFAAGVKADEQCPTQKVAAERLPDLNVPRGGHAVVYADDGLMVIGGHTTGFVPTPTAERYVDGRWQLVSTVYSHDDAMALPLSSGRVLIAGGHEKNLGIGQSYEVEMYDPATHSFTGFGTLDQKRTLLSGTEIDSGRVVVSGNWYADDAIELFDGRRHFRRVKAPAVQRSSPFIFRVARDDVFILSDYDVRGGRYDSIVVDRLRGEPFSPSLLQEWRPRTAQAAYNSSDAFVGDERRGFYASLFTVERNTHAQPLVPGYPTGDVAFVLLRDTSFTLVPTDHPVPLLSPVTGDSILYNFLVHADRSRQRAYLTGCDRHFRFYALCLDYAPLFTEASLRAQPGEGAKARLTLYYTDPLPDCAFHALPTLTPDGDLAVVGGVVQPDFVANNFFPSPSAWLIHVGQDESSASAADSSRKWLLAGVAGVALALSAMWLMRWRRRSGEAPAAEADPATARRPDSALMDRICQLMDEQQMFRNADLKVSDLASALSTNTRYITDCIKQSRRQTFSQFVNTYRIRHAQQLLRRHPGMKLTEVSFESGFANERSFFRTFKAITGMTAREWVQQQ